MSWFLYMVLFAVIVSLFVIIGVIGVTGKQVFPNGYREK
jgi:hypothetical protein